ncbi:carboxypeptidase S [Trichodelitschia bisporula]|uniref:Carboxypeptidase S n=1 Tax=Trichodelitschia bisporula TaxID=703511 RepID=A0A6G1I210_9PEZI|nr:carboxypeptidase S [Trichodelitschia bisporula]
MSEKGALDFSPRPLRPSRLNYGKYAILIIAAAFWLVYVSAQRQASRVSPLSDCAQVPPVLPTTLPELDEHLKSSAFRNTSIARLSNSVKIYTPSFDDLGPVGEDPRWDVFPPFAAYLNATFPRLHTALTVEHVNTHGLLYTWAGSDDALKPILFMAHQDVVPVPDATIPDWTYPPFSGAYDGKFIWGRGASDDKSQLIATLSALEALLDAGFSPQRTILVALGIDEESMGLQGAGKMGPFLLERYGPDALAAIVDEGAGFVQKWGTTLALPGIAEKGYLDVQIVVRTLGGHSSIPPAHTGIGVMSKLIVALENEPYHPEISAENPITTLLTCGAAHGDDFPKKLRRLLKVGKKQVLAHEVAKDPQAKYLITTAQSVTVINGGIKANALPEKVIANINYRVNIGSTTDSVKHKLEGITRRIAKQHNMTVVPISESAPGTISILYHSALEPAPVSPTEGPVWSLIAGTTRALYGEEVIVAGGHMTGNTDTKYFWPLTKHIFRFGMGWDGSSEGMGNIHTVDERASVAGHLNAIRWISMFVRNADAAEL